MKANSIKVKFKKKLIKNNKKINKMKKLMSGKNSHLIIYKRHLNKNTF